jgi:hypothetical protein
MNKKVIIQGWKRKKPVREKELSGVDKQQQPQKKIILILSLGGFSYQLPYIGPNL